MMSNRASLWIGFLAGGWCVTLLVLLLPALGLQIASAEDPPIPIPIPSPLPSSQGGQPSPLPVPQTPFQPSGRMPVPGGGTADSNNHAIALSASIQGGESVVYYFDTQAQRLLVYQYKGLLQGNKPLDSRDKGGLRLLAARHIDYDLKLEGYRDLSQQTRGQLKESFDEAFKGKGGKSNPFPVKKVGGVGPK
jgi:hypothetical protein